MFFIEWNACIRHFLTKQGHTFPDWHFKDVLHFFRTSVTNEKSCIKTISEREVDGALIASMNDKEMEVETQRLQRVTLKVSLRQLVFLARESLQ